VKARQSRLPAAKRPSSTLAPCCATIVAGVDFASVERLHVLPSLALYHNFFARRVPGYAVVFVPVQLGERSSVLHGKSRIAGATGSMRLSFSGVHWVGAIVHRFKGACAGEWHS
jgi:hypothetical protein